MVGKGNTASPAAPSWRAARVSAVTESLAPGAAALLAVHLSGHVPLAGTLLGIAALLAIGAWLARRRTSRAGAVLRYLGEAAAAQGPDPDRRETVVRFLGPEARGVLTRLETALHAGAALSSDPHARLVPALDVFPDPMILLDGRLHVVWHNRAAATLSRRDPRGRPLTAILRAPDLVEAAEAVVAGSSAETVEFVQPGPVARTFVAEVRRLAGTGEPGALLVLKDLTEQRRSERMRADFVANVSHELRTPLATLSGFVETLSGAARDDPSATERFLRIMSEQTERMARLVDDLLSLSRIEMKEHAAPTDRVMIEPAVGRVVTALRPQAEQRGMTISVAIAPGLPPATGNEDEVAQVAQNLVHNAIKYAREGSPIEITAERDGPGMVAFSVRDHGDGIPAEHLPRLTERFYRVDTARSRALGGTGLGLAIVKHIVNRHRGRLVIRSRLGEGSTFTVSLPIAADDAEPAGTGVTQPSS